MNHRRGTKRSIGNDIVNKTKWTLLEEARLNSISRRLDRSFVIRLELFSSPEFHGVITLTLGKQIEAIVKRSSFT